MARDLIIGFLLMLLGVLLFLRNFLLAIIIMVVGVIFFQRGLEPPKKEKSKKETYAPSNTTNVKPNADNTPSKPIVAQPTVIKTEPTAQNAYIYNLDYIKSCQSVFIAFDIETTGLSPLSDRIIELSAVRYENCSPCETFSTLINPQRHIPDSAFSVNHITDNDVKDAPLEKEAIEKFCNFIGKCALQGDIVLVAHNALFDIKFLLHAFSRSGIDANLRFDDTLYLARELKLGLPNNKLQTLAEHYGVIQENAHRAEDDARTCGEIFIKLLQTKADEHTAKFSFLSPDEMELCAWLKNLLVESDLNTQLLTFYNKAHLQIKCYGEVARFKTSAKKPYALISKDADIPAGIEAVIPSKTEAEKYLRVYYTKPSDLDPLKQYYIAEYQKAFSRAEDYIGDSADRMKIVARQLDREICI